MRFTANREPVIKEGSGKMSRVLASIILAATLGGCVVATAPGPYPYARPVGVAYVAPSYAIPGPGYSWRYHPHYGWGWWHPHYGWHRGWR
jgi:hypothetical protein